MNELQKSILKIFKQISKICDDNEIPYFAIGGTCIGAVRHKGFIPWDDDVDVAMPRRDYDRLAALGPQTVVLAEKALADNSAMSNAHYLLENRGIALKVV